MMHVRAHDATAPITHCVNAASEENTSGAPFPNDKNVTPAIFGDSFKMVTVACNAGQKNSSAVSPSRNSQYSSRTVSIMYARAGIPSIVHSLKYM